MRHPFFIVIFAKLLKMRECYFEGTHFVKVRTDAIKMPTYSTNVPYAGHICALLGAILPQRKIILSIELSLGSEVIEN